MKLGLIVRVDHRGLGIQTQGYAAHLDPHRILVIDATAVSPFRQHLELFPRALIAPWSGFEIDTDTLRRFLHGLDIVLTAETPYDWRLFPMAAEMGVRTVLHANAEFYRYVADPYLPYPTAVWLNTSWLSDRIPHDTILPIPVDRTHLPFRLRTSARTFLHVIGKRAARDRNGTSTFLRSLRHMTNRPNVIIRSQDEMPRMVYGGNVKVIRGDVEDYAELYEEGDVLVLPRRYGGGCLPMHEALSTGMPVIMPNIAPQNDVLPPECLLPAHMGVAIRTQLGRLPTYDIVASNLAKKLDELYTDDELMARLSKEADRIADGLSWATMKAVYMGELERAMDGPMQTTKQVQQMDSSAAPMNLTRQQRRDRIAAQRRRR